MTESNQSKLKRNLQRRSSKQPQSTLPLPLELQTEKKTWNDINLDLISHALKSSSSCKTIFRALALSVSNELSDHAIAIVQQYNNHDIYILAEDGLHHELKTAIIQKKTECFFLSDPCQSISNITHEKKITEDFTAIYEFIEHYWGGLLYQDELSSIFLMAFGTEKTLPTEKFRQVVDFSSRIVSNCYPEKKLIQFTSELAAQAQGRRMDVTSILAQMISKWQPINDTN